MVMMSFSSPSHAADLRFPVGLTYISGFGDVLDVYQANIKAEGYSSDASSMVPVGVSFQPYLKLDNGLGIGGGAGPIAMIIGSRTFFDLPVSIDARYIFLDADTAPYVRGGIKYHIASGDYVKGSKPGIFGAVGMELFRNSRVGIGMEMAYDSSEIDLETKRAGVRRVSISTKSVRPDGMTVSVFAIF
jgi:hypothetical protein